MKAKPRRKLTKIQSGEIKKLVSKNVPCNTVDYERKVVITNKTDHKFSIYFTNQDNSRVLNINLGGKQPEGSETTGTVIPGDIIQITTTHNIIF